MNNSEIRTRLVAIVALANQYCVAIEGAREAEKEEFVNSIASLLPRIYTVFADTAIEPETRKEEEEEIDDPEGLLSLQPEEDDEYYVGSYMDEQYYEAIRHNIETLLGPDDAFLETFEEDMKYSDTPIGASISENLTDIFQDLYNYVQDVRQTDGDSLQGAFTATQANFRAYWSQTLCNVMRPLNYLRYRL